MKKGNDAGVKRHLGQGALKRTNPCGVPAWGRRKRKDGAMQPCRRGMQ